jgi:hypothetical protein
MLLLINLAMVQNFKAMFSEIKAFGTYTRGTYAENGSLNRET